MNIEKCVFKIWEIPYLGLLIRVNSIYMNLQKIITIID